MGDREIVEVPDACSIPKWGPKKGLRYEVDDFIVSPPSNEDGGFFHLRYGQRTGSRTSTYDRINEELSMTVEIKDGNPMISEVNLPGSSESAVSPTLKITPTGLSPTNTADSTPEPSSSHSIKPLFVFHLKDSKIRGIEEDQEDDPKELSDSDIPSPTFEILNTFSQISLDVSEASDSSISELTTEEHIKKESLCRDESLTNINLLDKVHSLPTPPVDTSPYVTPLSTPITTPQSSPPSKRKISGVVMDQNASHSYFCTKPFQDIQKTSAPAGPVSGELSLSATAAQMTQQLENAAKTVAAHGPGQVMGKKRRPKPSTLREMNFWAPTSM